MKEKDKIDKSELSDFLRYKKGEMTYRERNAFERGLQKDPFAEEAAEGFSEISEEAANDDMGRFERQLKARVTRKNRFVYYRIAASVAVLMILSSVFLVINRNKATEEPDQSVEISSNSVTMEIPESKAITQPEIQNAKGGKSSTELIAAKETGTTNKVEPVAPVSATKSSVLPKERSEPTVVSEKKADELIVAEDYKTVPVAVISRQKLPELTIRGRIISTEDNLPIPGVTVMLRGKVAGVMTDNSGYFKIEVPDETNNTLVASFIGMKPTEFQAQADREMEINMEPDAVALNEVVVVGYGVSRSSSATGATVYKAEDQHTGYAPPIPSEGKSKFNRYIEENIRIPDILPEGEKAVVFISFIVNTFGVIDSIRVLRSPGPEFSDEAKRLLKEGPKWNPAERDGRKIDDEVTLRIVFK